MSNTNSTKRDPNTPELHSTGTLRGLKFFDEREDNFDLDTSLVCTPNITLIDSNTKAVFDFSGCNNISDNLFLDVLFSGLTVEGVSSGITLSNGKHIDSISQEQSNLSGVFNFKNKSDKLIFTDVISISSPQNYDKLYRGSGFIEKPDLKFSVGNLPSTKKNIVKNVLGTSITPNFFSLGARAGDYIQFINGNNKARLYQIEGISADNSQHEILSLTAGNSYEFFPLTEENRFNVDTDVNIYKVNKTSGEIRTQSGFQQVITYNDAISRIRVEFVDTGPTKEFRFDTLYTRPMLVLNTGSLYIFDLSAANSGGVGNFNISRVFDGVHAGGGIYTTGIQKYGSSALVYYPLRNETLYYYSTQVSGIGNKIITRGEDQGTGGSITTLGGFQTIQTGVQSSFFGTNINNTIDIANNNIESGTDTNNTNRGFGGGSSY